MKLMITNCDTSTTSVVHSVLQSNHRLRGILYLIRKFPGAINVSLMLTSPQSLQLRSCSSGLLRFSTTSSRELIHLLNLRPREQNAMEEGLQQVKDWSMVRFRLRRLYQFLICSRFNLAIFTGCICTRLLQTRQKSCDQWVFECPT